MTQYGSKTVLECVRRVEDGEIIAEVARSMGVSSSAICNWCREAGVTSRRTYHHFTEEEADRFAEMWAKGATYEEVSEEIGRTPASLATYAGKHRDRFPSRRHGGARYSKAKVRALEIEVERLRSLLRENGIEDADA